MEEEVRTVYTHLIDKVKFEIPRGTLEGIMAERGIALDAKFSDCDTNLLRLAYADMLKWFLLGPSKFNNTSDSDNGWSHSGGGYELKDEDRSLMRAEANAIYAELEPSSAFKRRSSFRVVSHGIKKANTFMDGTPVPHIIK